MRAYMSEGSRFDAVERAQSTFEQTAEREARAILAETEPQPFNYVDAPGALEMHAHTWDFYPHGHGLKETRLALAEALAAFVEREF